ncbi:hypothetical protein HPP92_004590 [Vanilla planifolia]|uniref:NAB domain-containing protein n=1 Tax=Vanilla planifolia TaxID=51239 RepID=A0A835VGJ9_VANPL|nr:hypothetical protein HPP92_004590 [Vanilla planifolia]
MRKQKLKKFLKSVVKSHGDVDDDKKEIENNVEKMLELFENNSADVSYGSDLVSIVNDIKKRCHSLYERHDGLTNLIKSKAWHRNRESSSGSSDSGSESSSDEDKPNNNHGQEVEQQISLEEYKSVLEKLNVISERNAELEAQNNAMHAKLEENEYLANKVAERQTVLTKLENELQTLRESFKLLQAEKELLKSDIERSKDREGSLGLSLKALQDENELLMIEKQNNSRMLLENEEALKKLKNDLEMIVDEADKVRNENVCLREELEKTAQEVVILNQQLAVTCEEKESSRTVAENLKLERVNLTSENARLHLENQDCNARLEASAMRVFHLNDRLLIAEEENNNLKTEVLSLSTHMKEAEKTIDDVSMQSGLMKEEICILQNKIDELNHQLKVKDDKKLEIEQKSSEARKMLQLAQEKCLLFSAEMETMKNENLLLLTRNDNLNQVLECNNEELSNLGQALKATEFERDTLIEEKFALLGKINEGIAIHVELKAQIEQVEGEKSQLMLKIDDLGLQLQAANLQLSDVNNAVLADEEEKRTLLTENSVVKAKLQEAELRIDSFQTQFGVLNEQNSILQSKVEEAEKDANDLKFERDGVIADNKKLQNKVEELKLKIHDLDLQLHAANLQLSDMNNAALAAEEQKRALIAENSIVKSKLQEIEVRIDNFQTQFRVLNEQNSILQSKVEEAEKDKNDLKFERDGVIADNKKLENKVEELKLKFNGLDLHLHAANLQLSDVNNAVLAAEEEKRTLLTENSVVIAKLQEAELRIDSFQTQFGVLNEQNSILQSKVEEAEKDANDLKFERDGVIADNKKLENKVEELKLKIHDLDLQLHAANLQLSDVNNAVLAAEEEKRTLLTENSVVKAKLQEAELRIDSFQTQFGVLNEQTQFSRARYRKLRRMQMISSLKEME